MGWATNLFCKITFNRETYNTKDEVLNRIDELEQGLKIAKDEIKSLVTMTEPNKFCPNDEEPLYWLINSYEWSMELIEEYTKELYKLNLLLGIWDNCHNENGLAIEPPSEIKYNTAFLDGDFVNTIKHPNKNE